MKIKLALAALALATPAYAGPNIQVFFGGGGNCYRPQRVICQPVYAPRYNDCGPNAYYRTQPVFIRQPVVITPTPRCGTTYRVARPVRPLNCGTTFGWRR